jgi:hypothetical protein
MKCVQCGSYAINEHMHGRQKGYKFDHCDVCYWQTEALALRKGVQAICKAMQGIHVPIKQIEEQVNTCLSNSVILCSETAAGAEHNRPFKQAINLSK